MKRRTFLKLVGATVAASTVPSMLRAAPSVAVNTSPHFALPTPRDAFGKQCVLSFHYSLDDGDIKYVEEIIIPTEKYIRIGVPDETYECITIFDHSLCLTSQEVAAYNLALYSGTEHKRGTT